MTMANFSVNTNLAQKAREAGYLKRCRGCFALVITHKS